MGDREIPSSTYRLQLRQGVGFAEALELVPQLDRLGIGVLYLSPPFVARQGSSHGYDVADPSRLDPTLGTEADLRRLSAGLQSRGMGLLIDIVPNHMAASQDNPWWMDVLESGPASASARFFDIDWGADPGEQQRLVLPALGRPYGEALEAGELRLGWDERGLFACYYEKRFPLDPATWAIVLRDALARLPKDADLRSFIDELERLPRRDETSRVAERQEAIAGIRARWKVLVGKDGLSVAVEQALASLSGEPGDPSSWNALDALLEQQAFRLCFWRPGLQTLNYRRFFDIADLVALRAEQPGVFEATHALILRLLGEGQLQGVRVDHVDGLLDPEGYLRKLRQAGAPWILVEKILVGTEQLPESWDADGTTGYEFAIAAGAVFVDPDGFHALEAAHAIRHAGAQNFEARLLKLKRDTLDELFVADRRVLMGQLLRLSSMDRHARDVTPADLARSLRDLTAALPVYRTYVREDGLSRPDRERLLQAVAVARLQASPEGNRGLDFLQRVLSLDLPPGAPESLRRDWLAFTRRWQQLTGPAMAKGMEDTALYVHNRLTSLNEVGGHPEVPADPVAAFHALCLDRGERWPLGLNASSTHDTKRSEDVRARIQVLSELPTEWVEVQDDVIRGLGEQAGDPEELSLLLQAWLGARPLPGQPEADFRDRLRAYVVKAAREAGTTTSWIAVNEAHEARIQDRVDRLVDGLETTDWGRRLLDFQQRVALPGAMNALSAMVLKLGAPGIPDIYQGSEGWNLSLVDPDNRRPVDFPWLAATLAALEEHPPQAAELLETWPDGRIKLQLSRLGLRARRADPELWVRGRYLPLVGDGKASRHLCAFAREYEGRWLVVAVPRLCLGLAPAGGWPLGEPAWGDATLGLPDAAPARWTAVFTGDAIESTDGRLSLATLFAQLPVSILRSAPAA